MDDLYSIGEMVIDFIPFEAEGERDAVYVRKAGGAPANVAIAVAKSGLRSVMCCKVGDDDHGRFLLGTLAEHGVRAACPEPCVDAVTTMAFVTLDERGDRRFTFARKPGADMMLSESDVREEDIAGAAIIHAGSCSLSARPESDATMRALRLAHDMGKIVSFDVNYRDIMWGGDEDACARAVMAVLPYVDLLKVSDAEVGLLGGSAALPRLMEEHRIALVVETLGPRGARALFDGVEIDVPGHDVRAVDTTGCGDASWGAFLSRLRLAGVSVASDVSEGIVRDALAHGNAAGALCAQSKGAIDAIPTRAQIEAWMARGA